MYTQYTHMIVYTPVLTHEWTALSQVAVDMTMVDSVTCPLDGRPSLLPLCHDKECLKTAEMELAVVGAVVSSTNKHTHACMNTLVYPLQYCEHTNGEPTPSHTATK